MAKMFYTMEEVQQKLGRSEDEIKAMVASGQIQEFRDRDKLMFKVEQIDLLAGSDDDASEVHLDLEDTGMGSGLDLSGAESGLDLSSSRSGSGLDLRDDSTLGLADSREGTGISVFDTDHGQADTMEDDAAETQIGDAVDDDLSLEAVGSGSGLLDLTRESDDTSLGAELLEEVYASDDNIEIPANASGLFEAAGGDIGEPTTAAMPMGGAIVLETYDGSGSGLGVGMMLGALVALVAAAIIVVVSISGATSDLAMRMSSDSTALMIWGGGLLGFTIVCGVIGLLIGKASE